jgi:carbamoylphosphate synthase large subunit
LIVALSNWMGAPRLPRAFERAGFHVMTFGFSGTLIQRSQAVGEAVIVSESIGNRELLEKLRTTIERVVPDLVVPTDDASVLAVHAVRCSTNLSERARAALADSLGDAGHAKTVRSRKLFAKLAGSLGVRTPAQEVVTSLAEARDFAARQGYPVVLKEEDSVAGMGVTICKDESELERTVTRRLAQNPAIYAEGVLVQSFVEGRTAMRVVAARRGSVLGGLSAFKLETWPTSTGPSTCVEFMDNPEMSATAGAVTAALGYSGFASLDFIVDGHGRAHLIELNPRPTPISHLGERFGACLCRRLGAALTGAPVPTGEPQGLPVRVALFPQEWVRDPESPHLTAGVLHDVPWDEPDLVEAYVAMGRGQMRFMAYRKLDARCADLRQTLSQLEVTE